MAFVAFLGCDGSGKSAVIQAVAADARAKGVPVMTGHWRPSPFRKNKQDEEISSADNPHGARPRGEIASVLKLGWLGLNWWVGWWQGLRSASHEGLLLFDRYYGDLLVDPLRYRYGGPMTLARLLTRCMPQPDLIVFLDAPPEVLLERKQEVTREALEKSRERYLKLCRTGDQFEVIDASQPLDAVSSSVLDRISKLAK